MTAAAPTVESARAALADCATDALALRVFGSDAEAEGLPSAGARRRATRRGQPDPVHRAALYLNPAGVLEWQLAPAEAPVTGGRRASWRAEREMPEGELVDVFELETLDVNSVTAFLEKADRRMNDRLASPDRMYRLSPPKAPGGLPAAAPVGAPARRSGPKRRLLFVHGTFSRSLALLEGIGRAPNGATFLDRVFATYDEVLAFEHPTLSVSPVLNAMDLRAALEGMTGPLDIIAHSRGGLVVRWALEAFGPPAGRVRAVLVGSPLAGTSLASPPRLRATIGLLSNFGTAVKAAGGLASAYVPLLLAPLAILKVATSVAGLARATPVLDGAIALIPGLAAQSRVRNNPELTRLGCLTCSERVEYHVVSSDFQPREAGWRFWQWFRGKRLANAAADKIFPGANDLVVDTESMGEIAHGIVGRREFGTNETVHHTNYFEQSRTLSFIMERLEMG